MSSDMRDAQIRRLVRKHSIITFSLVWTASFIDRSQFEQQKCMNTSALYRMHQGGKDKVCDVIKLMVYPG